MLIRSNLLFRDFNAFLLNTIYYNQFGQPVVSQSIPPNCENSTYGFRASRSLLIIRVGLSVVLTKCSIMMMILDGTGIG